MSLDLRVVLHDIDNKSDSRTLIDVLDNIVNGVVYYDGMYEHKVGDSKNVKERWEKLCDKKNRKIKLFAEESHELCAIYKVLESMHLFNVRSLSETDRKKGYKLISELERRKRALIDSSKKIKCAKCSTVGIKTIDINSEKQKTNVYVINDENISLPSIDLFSINDSMQEFNLFKKIDSALASEHCIVPNEKELEAKLEKLLTDSKERVDYYLKSFSVHTSECVSMEKNVAKMENLKHVILKLNAEKYAYEKANDTFANFYDLSTLPKRLQGKINGFIQSIKNHSNNSELKLEEAKEKYSELFKTIDNNYSNLIHSQMMAKQYDALWIKLSHTNSSEETKEILEQINDIMSKMKKEDYLWSERYQKSNQKILNEMMEKVKMNASNNSKNEKTIFSTTTMPTNDSFKPSEPITEAVTSKSFVNNELFEKIHNYEYRLGNNKIRFDINYDSFQKICKYFGKDKLIENMEPCMEQVYRDYLIEKSNNPQYNNIGDFLDDLLAKCEMVK